MFGIFAIECNLSCASGIIFHLTILIYLLHQFRGSHDHIIGFMKYILFMRGFRPMKPNDGDGASLIVLAYALVLPLAPFISCTYTRDDVVIKIFSTGWNISFFITILTFKGRFLFYRSIRPSIPL